MKINLKKNDALVKNLKKHLTDVTHKNLNLEKEIKHLKEKNKAKEAYDKYMEPINALLVLGNK